MCHHSRLPGFFLTFVTREREGVDKINSFFTKLLQVMVFYHSDGEKQSRTISSETGVILSHITEKRLITHKAMSTGLGAPGCSELKDQPKQLEDTLRMEEHSGHGGDRQTNDTIQCVGQGEDGADAGVNIYAIHCSLQIPLEPVMAFTLF